MGSCFFDKAITCAKDEQTRMAKEIRTNAWQLAINNAHDYWPKLTMGMWQYGCNIANRIKSAFNRTLKSINKIKQVRFNPQHTLQVINKTNVVMVTYNSRADGHYINKKYRKVACLHLYYVRPPNETWLPTKKRAKDNTWPVYPFHCCHQKQNKQTHTTNSPPP